MTDGSGWVYEWEYHGSFSAALSDGTIRPSSLDALVERAVADRLVFLGDDHRLPESQAVLGEIVRRIAARAEGVHLLLEMVPTENVPALTERLANGASLDLPGLQELLGWKEYDPFGQGHTDLIRLGRLPGVTIGGTEPRRLNVPTEWRAANPERLQLDWFRERDAAGAATVRECAAAEPAGRVVVVVYGCLHLSGPGHIPDLVGLPSTVAVSVSPALHARWLRDAPDCEALQFGPDRFFLPLPSSRNRASDEELGRLLDPLRAPLTSSKVFDLALATSGGSGPAVPLPLAIPDSPDRPAALVPAEAPQGRWLRRVEATRTVAERCRAALADGTWRVTTLGRRGRWRAALRATSPAGMAPLAPPPLTFAVAFLAGGRRSPAGLAASGVPPAYDPETVGILAIALPPLAGYELPSAPLP